MLCVRAPRGPLQLPRSFPPSGATPATNQNGHPGSEGGLGSERGLATPSPDAKGRETLSPVDVDHAAGTLTYARTQLRTRLI
jgi:hypothetical protein